MIKHSGCKFLIVVASLMWGLTASHAYAQNCELLFESPLQVHDLNGAVRFRLSSRVYDAPNDELITPLIIEEPLTLSCGWSDCSASGTTAPPIYINDFKLSAATTDIDVGILQSATTDGVQTQFRNVVVNSTGNLTFNSAQSEYLIDTLHLKLSATVKLPAGDYWVNNLIMDYGANIKVLGEGTVRLMVNNDTALADEVDINQTASAHQLFMYVNGSLNLGPNARLDGFVYSQGPMDVGSFSVLKGAFNASIVELHSGTAVYSRHDNAALVNYGDSCQQSFSYPDLDGDGIPDINDLDIDNDGIGNDYERMVGTDPYLASDVPVDADGDDVPDSLEGYAGTYCSAAFETGLQTHTQNGLVDFGSYSLMENAPTSQLRSSQVVNSNALFSADSCGNTDCSASGVPSPFILAPDFKFSTSSTDISGSATLGNDGQREFDEVTPLLFSTITFAQPGEYRIRKLNLWSSSTVVLAPGDYWIEQLSMASYTKIKVQGEGTVRLFVYSSSVTGNSSELNMPGGNEGDPAKLVIYAWQAFELGAYSDTSAYLYARGDINTEGSTKFYGAMAGANIDLSYSDKMYFRNQNLYQADFGLLCDVDNDGVFDGLDDDLDGDGLTNDLEAANNADPMNPDSDGDGLLDGEEVLTYQSNPQLVDSDSDGLSDSLEVWEFGTSPIKADTDDDGLSDTDELQTYETDPLVPDTDEDQLSDGYEVLTSGTDPLLPDTDEDGLLDGPEILTHGTDPLDADSDDDSLSDGAEINEHQTNPLAADSDADGLTDPQEINTTQTDPLNPDTDGDGLADGAEVNTHGTNPLLADSDSDGVSDGDEVNTHGTNPLQADSDGDGLSDGAELNEHSTDPLQADTDGDGLSDGDEVNSTNTDPNLADTDSDGLSDGDEVNVHNTDPLDADSDDDTLNDGDEINTHGTNPNLADSDSDGLTDAQEVLTYNTNPNVQDSDSDGLTDGAEVNTHGTDPLKPDSDEDGLSDGAEINTHGTNPLLADSDGDTLSDGDEINTYGSNPLLTDSDSDGIADNVEVVNGTNPAKADTDDDGVDDAADLFPTDPAEWSDLDGDGQGDNSDPDRDNDGYSNEEEVAAGSDPNDPNSIPDTTPPEITVLGSQPFETDEDYFTLNGIATDLSGVASLTITNDQSAGTITAQFSGDNWGADVPVELGVNNLQLKAVDTKGNEATVIVAVERLSTDTVVRLTIDSPVGYSKVTEPYVVVTGKLQSEVRSENIVLTVDNEPTALQSTALNTEYTYRSAPVQLQEGNNTILVQAVLDTQTLQRSVVVIYEPEVAETDAPLISLLSPAPGSMLNSDSFTLAGEAISFSGAAQIRVNGELVSLQGGQTQAGSFQEILNFPAGAESFQVTASITDGENRTVAAQAIYYRDITPPVISVGGGLQPVPTENRVVASRYELFGVISETNLAGFTVNGQPVSVEPGAAAGEYLFSLPLALSVSTPLTVELNARDAAGNSTSQEYTLLRDGSVTVDPLLPADGSEFINQGQPIALQVAAAIAGLSADLTTYAVLTNAADEILDQQTLSGSSTLLAGTVTIPAQAGDYDIAIEVRDLTDKVVGTAGLSVSVRDPQQVPVAIQKIEPANNATDIEPNGFVSVYFNQPVDPALVSITVNETLNGFTYIDSDPRGVSGMRGAGHRLVEVNRSFEAVAGSIAPLPGSTVMAFYPERELGYGANVFITVTYDGNEMERAQFKVRDLPTFITGGVQDQLGQPLAGITVKLKELNRSTKTDRDGAYHFGFGDAAKNNIPSGEYTLEFNPEFKDTRYGSISFRESVVEGRMNPMDLRTVPALDPTINFVPVQGGGEVTLLGGDLVMDLTDTRLVFPDQNTSGPIHVQFTDFSQFPYPLGPLGYGHWLYFVQPGGIAVEGSITGLDIAMPAIMGSFDYVPDNGYYVVMLGLDDRSQLIVPVGVGQIENYRVRSVGDLQYQRLDAIGYGMVPYEWQETLAKYANGDISLELMRAELSSVVNSTSGQ